MLVILLVCLVLVRALGLVRSATGKVVLRCRVMQLVQALASLSEFRIITVLELWALKIRILYHAYRAF